MAIDVVTSKFNIKAEHSASEAGKCAKDYPQPYSIRLTKTERKWLLKQAAGKPLSAYIRAKLFNGADVPQDGKKTAPIRDDEALAKTLAALGRSRLSSNLNQIAKAAHLGALPLTPELVKELTDACAEIQAMRYDLITALGLKNK